MQHAAAGVSCYAARMRQILASILLLAVSIQTAAAALCMGQAEFRALMLKQNRVLIATGDITPTVFFELHARYDGHWIFSVHAPSGTGHQTCLIYVGRAFEPAPPREERT
jgi:hypothetical protein